MIERRTNWNTQGNWADKAECRGLLELPWQSDKRPDDGWMAAMAEVCDSCPIRRECATSALSLKDSGGFWAGVWIPWYLDNGVVNSVARDQARAMLRRILAKPPLTEVST